MESEERKWLVLFDKPLGEPSEDFTVESLKLINLGMVRLVDQVTPTHIRLHFSESHTVDIHGGGAGELVLTLMSRGISVNGIPYPKAGAITPES